MKKLVYSPAYKKKIAELRKYLDFMFGPGVRKKTLKKLDEQIHMLQTYENMGISVRQIYGVDCDYLCIYAVKNYVFYRIDGNAIYIVSMYNEKEDFMQKMFGIGSTWTDMEGNNSN